MRLEKLIPKTPLLTLAACALLAKSVKVAWAFCKAKLTLPWGKASKLGMLLSVRNKKNVPSPTVTERPCMAGMPERTPLVVRVKFGGRLAEPGLSDH